MKVEVKGIVDGQELYWGYSADVKLVNITSDGTYDIPPLETVKVICHSETVILSVLVI